MDHLTRRCPCCGKGIKITTYAWRNFKLFTCGLCGKTSRKTLKHFKDYSGHVLEAI